MGTRPSVHDTQVKFRATAALVDAARLRARQQGKTLAETLRDALRREVTQPQGIVLPMREDA